MAPGGPRQPTEGDRLEPEPALDRVEARLQARLRRLRRGPNHSWVLVSLVLLALVVRLPFVPADGIYLGHHMDEVTYFEVAYAEYRDGDIRPLHHAASGFPLVLAGLFAAFDLGPPDAYEPGYTRDPEVFRAVIIAGTFNTALSAGAVALAYVLARELASPLIALGAAALVAVDPFLAGEGQILMSEPLFTLCLLAALVGILKARRHSAWFVLVGLCAAGLVAVRANGPLIALGLGIFACVLHGRGLWRQKRWSITALCVLLAVSVPYFAWRAEYLDGPLDYGTNSRLWADRLWDHEDPYWKTYEYGGAGDRETLGDYAATHDSDDVVARVALSLRQHFFDVFIPGGGPPDTPGPSVLQPLLAVLFIPALWRGLRCRTTSFLPFTFVLTLLPFLWMYPLVRSLRYYSPVIPLVVIVGVMVAARIASRARHPALVALAIGAPVLAGTTLWAVRDVAHQLSTLSLFWEPVAVAAAGVAIWTMVAFAPERAPRPRLAPLAAGDAP